MTTYHPWRDARRRKHLDIRFVDHLPTGTRGCSSNGKVELQRDMHQDERRSSLSHKLVHDERRIYPTDPVLRAKEEITVERIAARRLIELGRLVDVLCWTRHADEVAEELWVDVPMLVALIQSLSDEEREYIDDELERQGTEWLTSKKPSWISNPNGGGRAVTKRVQSAKNSIGRRFDTRRSSKPC